MVYYSKQKAPEMTILWKGPENTVYPNDKECVTERGTSIVKKFSSSRHLKARGFI